MGILTDRLFFREMEVASGIALWLVTRRYRLRRRRYGEAYGEGEPGSGKTEGCKVAARRQDT